MITIYHNLVLSKKILFITDLYVVFALKKFIDVVIGALWWTRTTDPRFRKPMLYPAELRAH